MTAITFSCQNDTGSWASNTQYWGNLFLVVVPILESKGLYYYMAELTLSEIKQLLLCFDWLHEQQDGTILPEPNFLIGAEEKFFINYKSYLVKMAVYWPRSLFFLALLLTLTKNSSRTLSLF